MKWSNRERAGFWLFTAAVVIPIAVILTVTMEWTRWFSRDTVLFTVGTGLTVWVLTWVLMVRK